MNRLNLSSGRCLTGRPIRRRVKAIVFTVLSVNVGALLLLLIEGCREEQPSPSEQAVGTNSVPAVQSTNTLTTQTNALSLAIPPVPVAATDSPVPAVPEVTEYAIVKGDTFGGLAAKFHVSAKAIAEANPGVDPTRLQVDEKIQIPQKPTGLAPARVADGVKIYVVKRGDTLFKIAGLFGTTPKAIRAENGIISDRIITGQTIKIPAGPSGIIVPQAGSEQSNAMAATAQK